MEERSFEQRCAIKFVSNLGKPALKLSIKWRRMRWAGHVAVMGEGRGIYRVVVGKPEGKRPLGRPRRRFETYELFISLIFKFFSGL
jgi:hypothetical protein